MRKFLKSGLIAFIIVFFILVFSVVVHYFWVKNSVDETINIHNDRVNQYGRFIEIEDSYEEYVDTSGLVIVQRLVYDKDTKIIYVISSGKYSSVYSVCLFYCMDENNNPIIAVYNGEED